MALDSEVMDGILTLEQAAEYLKIKPDQLYELSIKREVPCVDMNGLGLKLKKGTEFRYVTQMLLEYMHNQAHAQHSDED